MVWVRIIICALSISFFAGFERTANAEPNRSSCEVKAQAACEVITVFVTGNELGELRPCGCSGGQLGGFERRGALLNTVQPQQRLILDTGNLIKEENEQSLIKFDIIMQAFTLLKYDVVNLTRRDAAHAELIGNVPFKLITAQNEEQVNLPQLFSKEIELDANAVTVIAASFNDNERQTEKTIEKLAAANSGTAIKIAVFDGNESAAKYYLGDMGGIDIVIVRTEADEPRVLKNAGKKAMMISAGQMGKYVGRLDVRRAKTGTGFEFAYKGIAVDANLAQDPQLLELYKSYQTIVKNQGLLEKYPRYVLPDNLEYTGSTACGLKGCHDYEYKTATTQKHAHAFESLVLSGSDYDPECVICHTIGMEYRSGFITEDKTPELKDVGCENCHGPGSRHIVTAGKAKTTQPQSKCLDCHTSEQSANYAGQEREYCEKIFHWREPNALNCVQK
jgi:hypothetical protein